MTKKYVPTIGLEVHAELKTQTKMFCGCKNDPHDGAPNTHVCPVCTGQPGTLPVPNESAIESVLLFGRAVDATQAQYSEFDRKNYFYPDIPKAYQISQYKYPFLEGGSLKGVSLTRVHLEEDTARSQHDKGQDSLVDFNRAGVPLMELVTEPVITNATEAGDFARELQLLLRTLGISDANMERGEMRVEANISVSSEAGVMSKRYVEVKNINSFKAVESAIEYEIKRQTELLESGGELTQETRGWDENKSQTFSQRSKETAKDYRYFPDPDILKLKVDEYPSFELSRLDKKIPVLPNEKRTIYHNLSVKEDQIEILVSNTVLAAFFDETIQLLNSNAAQIITAVNYITSDVLAALNKGEVTLADMAAEDFATLIVMLDADDISSRGAKDLLPHLFAGKKDTKALATELGLLQVSDDSQLAGIISKVVADNPEPVSQFKAGKDEALKYLVGQGMKESRGAANPAKLAELLTTFIRDN